MRPAYLTPKLSDAHRLEIRRLRRENPKAWTLGKLAEKFGVHRSTISHVLRRRVRLSTEQEWEAARLAVETAGPIDTGELLRLKTPEWNRQLLGESDLFRQQQLVNLLKSTQPMLAKVIGRNGARAAVRDEVEDGPTREERMRAALLGA